MESLKKYLCKNFKDIFMIVAAGCVLLLAGIVLITQAQYFFGLVMTVFGIISLISAFTANYKETAIISEWEKLGVLDEIVADFESSEPFGDDIVRFGGKYIFRRRNVRLVKYADIVRAVYGHKAGMRAGDNYGGIYLYLKDGREELLCNVYDADKEKLATEIFNILTAKNPEIATSIE